MPFRPGAIILTTAEAASLLEITPARVRQLVTSGHIEKRTKDRITLEAAVKGYARFRREDGHRSSKTASASRVQDSRAREIDLKVAERENRLIDVVEHRDLFVETFGIVKSGLDSVPARVTSDLPLRRKIETEINDVLRRAADCFEQAARDPAPVGGSSAADAGDDT